MTGSLIVDFNGLPSSSNVYPYYTVTINGILKYSHTKDINELYSTRIETGDVVNLTLKGFNVSGFITDFGLARVDYTTLDSFGNVGITDNKITYTTIITGNTGYSYTFTATTVSNSYFYEYKFYASYRNQWNPFNKFVNYFIEQPDNKLIFGGSFDSYDGINSKCIIRLNSDNSIDSSFNVGSGFNNPGTSEQVIWLLNCPDGKIIAIGVFDYYNGLALSPKNIVRLNSDGSLDTTFDLTSDFTIRFQNYPDFDTSNPNNYKIYLNGYVGDGGENMILRFNQDGSYDSTFNSGLFNNPPLYITKVQPDGKILVGGQFTSYSGISCTSLIRLNYDGTVDNTFNIGSGFTVSAPSAYPIIFDIAIQSDNKILVVGLFQTFNGNTANGIVRLNSNGSIDTTFNSGTGFQNGNTAPSNQPYVRRITLTPDDKILIDHSNWTYNGKTSYYLTRLFSNGAIDETLNLGMGFDFQTNEASKSRVINDNKIISVGGFYTYNGKYSPYAVKTSINGNYIKWS